MATTTIELQGDITGIAEAPPFTTVADGTVSVIYEHNKCSSAWFEYTVPGSDSVYTSVILKPKMVPDTPLVLPIGAILTLKASVGDGGNFRAIIVY